jgi:hypothetical protein
VLGGFAGGLRAQAMPHLSVESDDAASDDLAVSALDRLARVLLDRCAWVYRRLDAGQRHHVHLQEETLTEDLLLDIAIASPGLLVRHFTRWQESRNGADWEWEWWFGAERWFGVRVQAKKLRQKAASTAASYHLDYPVGGDPNNELQVDRLRRQAREDGIPAAYVFYNGPALVDLPLWWDCERVSESREAFGVSYLSAEVVQQLVHEGSHDARTVASASRPWPCLVNCSPGGFCHRRRDPFGPTPSPLDEAVARNLFTTVTQSPSPNSAQRDPDVYLRDRLRRYRRDAAPEYVQVLINGGSDIDELVRPSVQAVSVFLQK